jgi:acetoacetyl-CoA synthetase
MNSWPKTLWSPSESWIEQSNLVKYRKWLKAHKGLDFSNYFELYNWSVNQTEDFWASMWEYFDIISHSPHSSILSSHKMPGAKWFEGATINYAEHILRNANPNHPAISYHSEHGKSGEISWDELSQKVAAFQYYLAGLGVEKGDRVVAFLPNCPEAIIAFLACAAMGVVWSSCSPDFGVDSVLERFEQIEPKVLITCDGYAYNGKTYTKTNEGKSLSEQLPTLNAVVWVPFLGNAVPADWDKPIVNWSGATNEKRNVKFEAVPFDHPIWVLYSSGTTGKPKAITQGHGGVLIEHLKYLEFHNDVKFGERFFWYSTTGWMMWNFSVASMLRGATVVLYDGSPAYPSINALWQLAETERINHFGTSAPFIVACMKKEVRPGAQFDLSELRSIGSTGAPLPPEGFDYIYESVKSDVWLCSMSGGTDVCTAFVGGCPTRPVFEGEIQCRALGCSLKALDEAGNELQNEVGEMVITKPMPSMPIYFWNDPDMDRYTSSYFEEYPGLWRHGDWIKITERDSLIILGRSDATLNRHGVRIGTAEIYSALDGIPQIEDALIVNLELEGGEHFMPLFVKLANGNSISPELENTVKQMLKEKYSPRHVPDKIIVVPDIPYTISGKKMETPVKKILLGMKIDKAANPGAMKNPDSLDFFREFATRFSP